MFNKLVEMAKEQDQPQRLLFLFAEAENASGKTSATEKNPRRGALTPKMCVDKLPDELIGYPELVAEADSVEKNWNFVFVAGLSGQGGKAPSTEDAEQYLNKMTNDLTTGNNIAQYVVFDREGNPIEMMVN